MSVLFFKRRKRKKGVFVPPLETAMSQMEYLHKFSALVLRYSNAIQLLHPDRDTGELMDFVDEFKSIKREFTKGGLDPNVFKHSLTDELYRHVRGSYDLFKRMISNGEEIVRGIEAYDRTGDEENLKAMYFGVMKHFDQSRKVWEAIEKVGGAYNRLEKRIGKYAKRV